MNKTEAAARLVDVHVGDLPQDLDDARICYWRADDGGWWIYLPRGGIGRLTNHTIAEHDDGTITVSPIDRYAQQARRFCSPRVS